MTEATDDYDSNYVYGPQEIAMAIVPKFGAALSFLGSICIIGEVWNDHKQVSGRAVSRILLSMSTSDLFFSLGWFLTTWPSPVGTPYAWGAVGNQAACSFQAFIIQLGWMATPLFNISLAFFYLLMIRYAWSEKRLRRLEPWVHGIIWSLGWGTAIMGLPLGIYNSNLYVCWIDSSPYGCVGDECDRGQHAWIYAIVFQVFPVMVSIVCSVIFFGMIVYTVFQNERKSQRHQFRGVSRRQDLIKRESSGSAIGASPHGERQGSQNDVNHSNPSNARHSYEKSRIVAQQALWYVGAFLITFVPDMISACIYYASRGEIWIFWFDVVAYFLLPAQGFFNFCVFVRRRQEMKTRYGKFLRSVLCCCQGRRRSFIKSKSGWMMGSSDPKNPSSSSSGQRLSNHSSHVERANPTDHTGFSNSGRIHHQDLHEESFRTEDGNLSSMNRFSSHVEEAALDEESDRLT